jgi:hypothetical protein
MTQTPPRKESLPMTPTEAFHAARQDYIQRVLHLLITDPDLPYLTVALRSRVSLRTATRIAADAGIHRKRGRKPRRRQYLIENDEYVSG